ncbi:MAG: T9SS type A sorting domain-containing protein, partial [Melioribacteraceae bacterium]
DGGVLNFGSMNLTFQTAFTRTAGTAAYQATTGYMIWDGAAGNLAVTQGTDGFSVPNLRITNSGAFDVVLNSGATQGTVTVTGAFDLNNGVTTTQEFTTNDKFAIADGATVNYTSGTLDAAPAYAGSVTMVGKSFLTGEAFPALLWPSTGVTVTTLTINGAGAVNTIALPGDRTVTTALNLTKGVLALGANSLTLGTGATIVRTDNGSVTVGAGGFVFPTDNSTNVTYYANAAGIGTGDELPATLNNLTVSRNTNGANQAVTVNSSVAINGTFTLKNNFTIPVTPPVVTVSVNGNLSIVNDAANYALATNPVLTNNQSLVIGGASGDQTITVPSATPALNVGAITINKASGNVVLAGGNLATGTITFTKGNIVTGNFILYIPAPTTAAVAGGAVSQGFTGASENSMVVGNVAKTFILGNSISNSTEATSIFPVGTGTMYRPASLTFNPAFGQATNPNATIVVSHVDSNPGGTQALPIANGVAAGIDVSRYPNFYWNIYTVGTVGQSTVFDLGLTAGSYTDYDSPSNVRIIRRHGAVGDINNDWLLQGVNTGYDNEVNSTTGFTAINRNSIGGLRTGGAVFTLGVKSNISVLNPIAKQWLVIPQGAKTVSLANVFQGNIGELSFTAQSSNPAVATATISGTGVVLTPIAIGEAFVTIKAVDAANNDFFAYTFAIDSRNTDVATTEEIPTEFALSQNFPNPFNPTTNIKFALPKESNVTLKIYNILGEEVANLVNKVMPAGYHTVNFDATRYASGMYIYRIEAGSFVQVKKMLLMK